MKWDSMRTTVPSCLPWLHWTALCYHLFHTAWSKSHLQKWTSLLWSSNTLYSLLFVTSSSYLEVFWWFRLLIWSVSQLKSKRSTRLKLFSRSLFRWLTSLDILYAVFQSLWWIQEVISTTFGQTTLDQTLSKSSLSERLPISLCIRLDSWPPSVINTTTRRSRPFIALTPFLKSETLIWSKKTSNTCYSVNSATQMLLLSRAMELPL